jgi:hypothetical protein
MRNEIWTTLRMVSSASTQWKQETSIVYDLLWRHFFNDNLVIRIAQFHSCRSWILVIVQYFHRSTKQSGFYAKSRRWGPLFVHGFTGISRKAAMFCSQSSRGKGTRDFRYSWHAIRNRRAVPSVIMLIPFTTVFAIWGFTNPYKTVVQTKRVRAAASQYGRPQVIMCMETACTLSRRTTLINKVPISWLFVLHP